MRILVITNWFQKALTYLTTFLVIWTGIYLVASWIVPYCDSNGRANGIVTNMQTPLILSVFVIPLSSLFMLISFATNYRHRKIGVSYSFTQGRVFLVISIINFFVWVGANVISFFQICII